MLTVISEISVLVSMITLQMEDNCAAANDPYDVPTVCSRAGVNDRCAGVSDHCADVTDH
jgi:hypothetical protein